MCFKKPKLPEPTVEDKELEAELTASRLNARRDLAASLKTEKDFQTEAVYARLMGFVGNRSLITGPKGGSGFLGPNSGKGTPGRPGGSSTPAPIGGSTSAARPSRTFNEASYSMILPPGMARTQDVF